MQGLEFTKMHGLGNDFVVVDATRQSFDPDSALLTHLADRRFGIGCDQILVIDPPPRSAPGVDFGYRIYNADGSEVGQCGNGARCLACYVRDHGLSRKSHLVVRTRTSQLELYLLDDGRVRVNMGAPRFDPQALPLRAPRAERYTLAGPGGEKVEFGAVSMGNPHAVIEVADVATAPVATVGEAWQHDAMFPERVNVGFIQFEDRGHARLRVYERGAGETLACGSGACAAAAVGRLWGRLDAVSTITVKGGELQLEWSGEGEPVWMTGPAATVYEGRLILPG
ncbi:MAG: diaminopimelate epimerase [Nevskiaceae bacterium]|nr:MAG: diaminopimelate epimerase [Nevskiaceae bacterium]TBR74152.1 MAG: diaminopimelate epimerase [Nevskiaceae bacterium]